MDPGVLVVDLHDGNLPQTSDVTEPGAPSADGAVHHWHQHRGSAILLAQPVLVEPWSQWLRLPNEVPVEDCLGHGVSVVAPDAGAALDLDLDRPRS